MTVDIRIIEVMRDAEVERARYAVLEEFYPAGFLQQLGSLLSQPAGLEDPYVEDGFGETNYRFPVRTKKGIVGTYILSLQRPLGGSAAVADIRYEGEHPLFVTGILRGPNGYWRNSVYWSPVERGNASKIVFPGHL